MKALRGRVRRAQDEFLATVDGLDKRDVVVGEWSIHDIAAHLVDWNLEIILAAQHLLGQMPKPARHPIVDFDHFNAESVALRGSQPWSELRDELERTVERALELAEQLAQRLEEQVEHPWNNHGTIRDLFHGVCGHQEEHTAELRAR